MRYGLYVVTDEELSLGRSHAEIAAEAVAGGADIIQLRDKHAAAAKLYGDALAIKDICRGRAGFIVNDRADIALAAGADGVHLGREDLPILAVRKMAPLGFIIGLSVGSVEEALAGAEAGADYLAVSPVFSTPSKADAGEGLGYETISAIKRAAPHIPLVGIGGLNEGNAFEAIQAGLDCIAVISAVVSLPDIKQAARDLAEVIGRAKASAYGSLEKQP